MSTAFYTVRYRSKLYRDKASLIVEDDRGRRFHFTCHPDHCTLLPLLDEFVTDRDLARLGRCRCRDGYDRAARRILLGIGGNGGGMGCRRAGHAVPPALS